jgi:hypothetical protein
VYDNLCAEGLRQFIKRFTLSDVCGLLPGMSREDCSLFLQNSQTLIFFCLCPDMRISVMDVDRYFAHLISFNLCGFR